MNGTSRLDVASPGVNFLMKSDTVVLIMTGSPTRAIHVRQKPCTHGLADADIVSAFPLSISTFQENINTLRQTSRHDIPSAVGVLRFEKLSKTPVALARAISFIKILILLNFMKKILKIHSFFS